MSIKTVINKKVISMILSLALKYLKQISPELIGMIDEGIDSLQAKAAATDSPIDDIVVNLVRVAFDAITGGVDNDDDDISEVTEA